MNTWPADTLDRALRTALQTLAAYLTLAHSLTQVAWGPALAASAFAALVSVLTSLIALPSFGEQWTFQMLERATKTFAQNLLVGIGAAVTFAEVDWKMALNVAGLAALYSVVTSVMTTRSGSDLAYGQINLTAPPNRGGGHALEEA